MCRCLELRAETLLLTPDLENGFEFCLHTCIYIPTGYVFIPTTLSSTHMALFVQIYIPLLAHLC